ncbi:MAG: cupin domain-containing protein [Gemmatimonadetes bacterium]|jgi:quercetin dioxygenase-like cupin family protein|nr:cupin domain-containing protein [Gemmatimonadota bacterium]
MTSIRLTITAATLALTTGTLGAQQGAAPAAAPPALTRTVLVQKTLSAPGRDGVLVRAELVAGGSSVRHTHPGEEFGYVLDGTVSFDLAGQPTQLLKAGDSFFIPPNTPHIAHNTGTTPVKLISTYIVETGKPLSTPAP